MGNLNTPPPVTPIVAILAAHPDHFQAARGPLEKILGPAEIISPLFPFNAALYYAPTMGPALQRCFFAFERFADPAHLAAWKLAANELEFSLQPILAPSGQPARPINIDPGYVTTSKLVLASTKDFKHRIYLRDGIYAEITMAFRAGKWISHPCTFPDFESGIYDAFLKKVRDNHMRKLRLSRNESNQPMEDE